MKIYRVHVVFDIWYILVIPIIACLACLGEYLLLAPLST